MRTTRKLLVGILAAAGLATASAVAYSQAGPGYGPGYGPCATGAGPGAGYGPGMMGGRGGYGPGMMGGGPRGGYGPGMMGGRGGYGPGAGQGPCGGVPGAACDGSGPGMMGWGGGPRGGFGPGVAGANPTERAEARLAFLKDTLKITGEQQAAWDAYANQVKANATTMEAFWAKRPAAADTPAERFEQRAERMKLRATQAEAMSGAVKDLYAVLTPEQKAIADQHFGGVRTAQAGRGYGRGRW